MRQKNQRLQEQFQELRRMLESYLRPEDIAKMSVTQLWRYAGLLADDPES